MTARAQMLLMCIGLDAAPKKLPHRLACHGGRNPGRMGFAIRWTAIALWRAVTETMGHRAIVPRNSANKGRRLSAKPMEPTVGAWRNRNERDMHRTPSLKSMSRGLD